MSFFKYFYTRYLQMRMWDPIVKFMIRINLNLYITEIAEIY